MARSFVSASSQYFGHTLSAPVTDAPFSISAWDKHTSGTENRAIVTLGKTSTTQRHFLYTGNNYVYFFSADGGFGQAEKSGLTAGAWNHVGAQLDANNLRYSIRDGVRSAADTTNVAISGFDRIYLGVFYSSGGLAGAYNNDTLADVGIWNVALKTEEWAALAAGVSPLLIRPSALVGYWPLHGRATDEEDWAGGRTMTGVNGPTVSDSPRIIVPASYRLDAPAAVVSGTTVTGALGTATASGLQGNVNANRTIAGTLGTATASGFTGTVQNSTDTTIAGNLGTATASGFTGGVNANRTIAGNLGTATASGFTGGVNANRTIAGALGTAVASGFQGTVTNTNDTVIGGTLGIAIASGLLGNVNANTTIAGNLGTAVASGFTGTVQNGTPDTLDLILKILRNRQELNPATGTFTLYDDDATTVLYTTSAWADAAGTVPYSGGALRRIDALF